VVRRHFDPVYTHGVSLTLINPFKQEVENWLKALKNDSLRAGVGRMVVHAPTSCGLLPLRVIPLSFYGEAFDDEVISQFTSISFKAKNLLGIFETCSHQRDAETGA
jgi:cytochrome P450 monooxygenase